MKPVVPTEFDPDVLEANDEAFLLRRRAERAGRSVGDQRAYEEVARKERADADRDAYLARRREAAALWPGSGWGRDGEDPMEADKWL